VLRVFREPPPHGLRLCRRCLADEVAVEQEVETLVLDVHTGITGEPRFNPQTDRPSSPLRRFRVTGHGKRETGDGKRETV